LISARSKKRRPPYNAGKALPWENSGVLEERATARSSGRGTANVREPRAFAQRATGASSTIQRALVVVRPALEDADRLAAPAAVHQVLAEPVAVVRDERVGRVEDVPCER